jgi:hypothetical protein
VPKFLSQAQIKSLLQILCSALYCVQFHSVGTLCEQSTRLFYKTLVNKINSRSDLRIHSEWKAG